MVSGQDDKTVPLAEYDKLRRENEELKQERAHLEKKLAERKEVLNRLSEDVERMSEAAQQSELGHVDDQLRHKHLEVEAREMQRRLLPSEIPDLDGLRSAVCYSPSRRLGGDFYDFIRLENGRLAILIGDASGHSFSAVLVSSMAKTAFKNCVNTITSPKKILAEVNRQLLQTTVEGQFVAVFLAILDCPTLKMKYANASHACPILYNNKGKFEALDTDGSFVGMFEDPNYEEKEVQLELGDRILFMSDGVRKVLSTAGEGASYDAVHEIVQKNGELGAEGIVNLLREEVRELTRDREIDDDVTMVALQVVPREAMSERFVLMTDPKEIQAVETVIRRAMERRGFGERDLFAVKLAIEEAIINAMKHGNRMDRHKQVVVDFSLNDKGITLEVEDEGPGFKPDDVPDPTSDENLELPHGRGIVLMRAYMDEISYNGKGNRVIMAKYSPWAS
ncbi:MAG: SpoIIE family protein phosphatase [Planctomycetes bacterium]|nr:SpoIIE family protein phosphatase [Planctomycetota bacterium]